MSNANSRNSEIFKSKLKIAGNLPRLAIKMMLK